MKTVTLFVVLFSAVTWISSLESQNNDDVGDPLYITPYIEQGKFSEAKTLAMNTDSSQDVLLSYSGFFTVDAEKGTNSFFWFFPAEDNSEESPLIVWLQGGPGASSLYGAFFEIGPYEINSEGVVGKREYYWSKKFNLLFVDNPAGAGFSYSEKGDYATNETTVGRNLLFLIQQFYLIFPELKHNPFYVAGESYGGKYVPALAHAIHESNKHQLLKINLKGIAIGNGLIDPVNMMVHGPHLYQLGLIDDEQLGYFNGLSEEIVANIHAEDWGRASDLFTAMFMNPGKTPNSLFYNDTGFTFHYNILESYDDGTNNLLSSLMDTPNWRKLLHVGTLPFNDGTLTEKYLHNDVMKSALPLFIELAENYDVLLYSGQLDIIIPYPTTVNFLKKMDWLGAKDYLYAPRNKWIVGNDIAGYTKTVYHEQNGKSLKFTEILVRSAGHIVPRDQPERALDMITKFITQQQPF